MTSLKKKPHRGCVTGPVLTMAVFHHGCERGTCSERTCLAASKRRRPPASTPPAHRARSVPRGVKELYWQPEGALPPGLRRVLCRGSRLQIVTKLLPGLRHQRPPSAAFGGRLRRPYDSPRSASVARHWALVPKTKTHILVDGVSRAACALSFVYVAHVVHLHTPRSSGSLHASFLLRSTTRLCCPRA